MIEELKIIKFKYIQDMGRFKYSYWRDVDIFQHKFWIRDVAQIPNCTLTLYIMLDLNSKYGRKTKNNI